MLIANESGFGGVGMFRRPLISLRVRLTVWMVALALGGLWLLAIGLAAQQQVRLRGLAETQLLTSIAFVASHVDDELQLRLDSLADVAGHLPRPLSEEPGLLARFLTDRLAIYRLCDRGLMVVRLDGSVLWSEAGRGDLGVGDDQAVRVAATGRTATSVRVTADGQAILQFAVPVVGDDGKVEAVLVGYSSGLGRSLLDPSGWLPGAAAGDIQVIEPRSGRVIGGSQSSATVSLHLLDASLGDGPGRIAVSAQPDGVERLVGVTPVPATDWLVVGRLATAVAFAPIQEMREQIVRAGILLSLVIGLVASHLVKYGLQPLRKVVADMTAMSDDVELVRPLADIRDREVGGLVIAFNRLIERLKHDRQALSRSETLLVQSQRMASIGHYVFDIGADHWDSSATLDAVFGIGEDYPHNRAGWLNLIHAADRPDMEAYLVDHVLGQRQPFDRQYRIVRPKDGAVRWVRGVGQLDLGSDGAPLRLFGVVQDITAQRQFELELENERAHLRTLLKTIPDPVWLKDLDGVYLNCNAAFEGFFGAPEAEIVGKTDYDFVPPDLAAFFRENDRAAVDAGLARANDEWVVFACDGVRRLLQTIKTPMRDRSDQLVGILGIARDITTLRQTEEALRESEERLRALYDLSPLGIALIDRAGHHVHFNAAYARICGYAEDELRAVDWRSLTPERYLGDEAGHLEALERTGCHGPYEKEFLRRDGSLVPVCVNSMLVTGRDGDRQIWSIVEDISERVAIHRRLSDLSTLNTAVITSSTAGILVYRGDGCCILANEAAARVVGCTVEQLLGQDFRTLESWRHCGLLATAEAVLADGRGRALENGCVSSFGHDFSLSAEMSAFTNAGERHLMLVIRDVTAEKAAREALRASEERYRGLVESQSDFVVRIAGDGSLLFANDAFARTFGRTAADVVGEAWLNFVHPDDVAATAQAIGTALSPPAYRATVETRIMPPSGPVWVAWEGGAIFDSTGAVGELQAVGRDVTAVVEARQCMSKLMEDLTDSNQQLEQFAYAVSHDLREPLRMVISYIGLLQRRYGTLFEGDAGEFMGFVVDGARRMDHMVVALLDLSRVGRSGQAKQPVSLARVIDTANGILAMAIRESGATIAADPGLPVILGIEDELVSLMQNLISNAIKYRSPDRALVVTISWRSDDGNWIISVGDNGIGIAPEYQERVFGIFQRLHSRGSVDGTGIGLALARKIVEHHGGRLWVDSESDVGSVFSFSLPKMSESLT